MGEFLIRARYNGLTKYISFNELTAEGFMKEGKLFFWFFY